MTQNELHNYLLHQGYKRTGGCHCGGGAIHFEKENCKVDTYNSGAVRLYKGDVEVGKGMKQNIKALLRALE